MISIGSRPPSDYATGSKQDTLAQKSASDLVTEQHDSTNIVYLGNGSINYIQYLLDSAEVARKTFSYNGSGELTGIIKTP